LHGYPETHACWHKIAPALARRFTVVACDLPGYGKSTATASDKRTMARELVATMSRLGFSRFRVAGHDRGARVAYRMALDHPRRVATLAVVSILPTFAMWRQLRSTKYAMKAFRWFFMAQPAPMPETLIEGAGVAYLHATLSGWTKSRDLSAFDADALAAYEAAHTDLLTIAASCADYRAGWHVDRLLDETDLRAGAKIECPTLVLWGTAEFPDEAVMMSAWREIAADVRARPIDCGHFAPEEAPDDVARALIDVL
jgi:haloacetate dehalogenase